MIIIKRTQGKIIIRSSGMRGLPGEGVPTGGVAGQVLTKQSNADYDTDWQESPSAPVQSVNGEVGAVVIDKSDLGLGNVDNTSDASKPISTATQTALNAKIGAPAGDLLGTSTSPVTPYAYHQSNKTQAYVNETVISNFQAGHGFVKDSATGTQADDTTVKVRGTQSLRLTTNGANGACFSKKTGLNLNIANKHFRIWVMVDEPTRVSELFVYFSSDNVTANWMTIKPSDDTTVFKPNVWTQLTFTQGRNSQVTGAPNLASINSVQVRVRDNSTGVVNAWFGGITMFDTPPEGVVSISFDDNYATVYNNAKPVMDSYGYRGTMYTIPMRVGLANYMTVDQLKEIHSLGWDVANHTYNHIDMTTLTAAQVEAEAYDSKRWFIQNSFWRGIDDMALPQGRYNDTTVLPILKKYFRSVRTINNQVETQNPGDLYKLRTLYVINTTTTATIQTAITNAFNNREWLHLVFHDIPTGAATQDIQYTLANFTTVMAALNTAGIAVKPVSEVLDNAYRVTRSYVDAAIAAIPAAPVQSVSGRTGVVTLTKTDVGLENVDNTSDVNKPISITQQTALDAKATDSLVVHLAGTETITGQKTFSGIVSFSSGFRTVPIVRVSNQTLSGSSPELNICDATSGNISMTLPSAASVLGQTYTFKKSDATANTVTVVATIEGIANRILSTQWQGLTVRATSVGWIIV